MPEFPPIAHVAVTVTDLERSTRWYGALLAAEPVLDEDEQAGAHHTVFARRRAATGLHTHPRPQVTNSTSAAPADHVAFAPRPRRAADGPRAWTSLASYGGTRTPTAPVSPSATRTELPSSSSRRLPDPRTSRKPARATPGSASRRTAARTSTFLVFRYKRGRFRPPAPAEPRLRPDHRTDLSAQRCRSWRARSVANWLLPGDVVARRITARRGATEWS